MNIHFYTGKGQSSPTARLRGYLLVKHLRKSGIKVILHAPPKQRSSFVFDRSRFEELIHHFKVLKGTRKKDVIYLVRTVFQLDFVFLIFFFGFAIDEKLYSISTTQFI